MIKFKEKMKRIIYWTRWRRPFLLVKLYENRKTPFFYMNLNKYQHALNSIEAIVHWFFFIIFFLINVFVYILLHRKQNIKTIEDLLWRFSQPTTIQKFKMLIVKIKRQFGCAGIIVKPPRIHMHLMKMAKFHI